MTHKKVFNHNVILAIPEGKKCFAWFTTYKEDNVCFIMEISGNNRITNIHIGLTGFNDKLVLGTSGSVFYGTTFKYNDVSCFCIEDLYFYKGINYSSRTFVSRLDTLKTILSSEISQQALTRNYIIFGMPLMNSDLLALLREIDLLPYKIGVLKYRWFETKKIMCSTYYKPGTRPVIIDISNSNCNHIDDNNDKAQNYKDKDKDKDKAQNYKDTDKAQNYKDTDKAQNYKNEYAGKDKKYVKQLSNAIFNVTPDIQSDIYNLFSFKDGKEEFYDCAFIPDYETSKLMNNIFRNIKENANLDALEESDDEDEFENDRVDKYVYLDRRFKMNCQFNYKFKKWVPISMAE